MDGRGAWRDNVFVERLWRSVKYEEVYLRAYDGVAEARASICRYLGFRSDEHTSVLLSLMRISYVDLCLEKKQYTRIDAHECELDRTGTNMHERNHATSYL